MQSQASWRRKSIDLRAAVWPCVIPRAMRGKRPTMPSSQAPRCSIASTVCGGRRHASSRRRERQATAREWLCSRSNGSNWRPVWPRRTSELKRSGASATPRCRRWRQSWRPWLARARHMRGRPQRCRRRCRSSCGSSTRRRSRFSSCKSRWRRLRPAKAAPTTSGKLRGRSSSGSAARLRSRPSSCGRPLPSPVRKSSSWCRSARIAPASSRR
mmetsp:Transcript_55960/g.144055  ORF Transcript_55960/g.144055 Transcript_55960/m.144055 type:complete len:213 (+) Transcript_55960:176-814(+)